MGKDARVYLSPAELAAVCALLDEIPIKEEHLTHVNNVIEGRESEIYK